jgi:transposase
MYLRTTRRKNKDGSVSTYYQLAHNERHPDTQKPVAKIIHSFGRADTLDREQLIRLCRSIARVCGVEVVDPVDNSTRKGGLPRNVIIVRTLQFGAVSTIAHMWEQLGIGKTLRDIVQEKKYQPELEKALLAMVANRLCVPESKLGVWDRWLDTVYMPQCSALKLRQMYEAMDMLYEHAEYVEEKIFYRIANLMNLFVDIIFYDTTTASFSVDYADEDGPRQYGHAKEGVWAPQVVVALAVTREGIPVRSWVFPGNTADVSTVKKIKEDLRGWNLGRALFVADSGMNSHENRQELAKACGKYLLATRMASVAEIKKTVLSQPGRYKKLKDNMYAKEVTLENGKRYIICFNPKEAKRQAEHRQEIVAMLEEELASHKDKDASAQWAIDLLASRRYKKYLAVSDTGTVRIDRAAIKVAGKYDGKWVLETNDDTISLEDAAHGYRGLMIIERCFRALKRTQIKMMPMYHWLPRRIEAHVKICILALLIERIAEIKCDIPWSQIKQSLQCVQATQFKTPGHVFFQLNELSAEANRLLEKLAVQLPAKVFGIKHTPKSTAIV